MDLFGPAEQYHDEIISILKELCVIPAPSGFEDERAEYVLTFFRNLGIENAHIDDTKNVVCTLGEPTDDIYVFMAHTDIVFPFDIELNLKEDKENLYCPGIGDDTARLVLMMMAIKHIVTNNIKLDKTIMFVANACEEGLGNLKGCRKIFADYGNRIKRMYTFDGSNTSLCNRSVGSHRYEVTALTEGGHSYGAFGNRNAINVLAWIVNEIYKIEVPQKENTKTTYNVGTISGGTTVNTIAQKASMLVEYRSDDVECLDIMKKKYQTIFEEAKGMCSELIVDLVGERPCMSLDIDFDTLNEMADLVELIQRKHGKCDVTRQSVSTDANIPHSLGIPAICLGAGVSGKAHTTEEWTNKEALKSGFLITLELILTEGNAM